MDIWQRQRPMFSPAEAKILNNTTVMVAGAGGLGTHQALELQRIGVKKIYLYDPDRIEASNLNRQVLYGSQDLGKLKVKKAKETLDSFQLQTELVISTDKIDIGTKIEADVDLVLDALDNFFARFKLEKLCQKHNLPLIHGGIEGWYGQLTTIIPGETIALKDIFNETNSGNGTNYDYNPDSESLINTGFERKKKQVSSFSPAVAVIAALQVLEAVNIILNKENNLKNKLLLLDLRDYSIEKIEFQKW